MMDFRVCKDMENEKTEEKEILFLNFAFECNIFTATESEIINKINKNYSLHL